MKELKKNVSSLGNLGVRLLRASPFVEMFVSIGHLRPYRSP